MKKIVFYVICSILPIFCFGKEDSLYVYTIPKGGTHLTQKYFFLLNKICPKAQIPHNVHYYDFRYPPKCCTPPSEKFFSHTVKPKSVFVIRDFRDILISAVNFFDAKFFSNGRPHLVPWAAKLSFSEKLMELIKGKSIFPAAQPFVECYKKNTERFREAIDTYQDYLIVKFEDLTGPSGGGSKEEQLKAIYLLASQSNIDLTPDEAEWISARIYGKGNAPEYYSITFRGGSKGKWKEHFTEEHKEEFKKRYNWILVDYGYENDDNW